MHSVRLFKFYYFAAFLLGALVALLVVAPVRANGTEHAVPDKEAGVAARATPDAYS